MKISNKRELYSAALIILIGIGTVAGSLNYNVGTLARMGPGYYPLLLGGLLIFMGVLILATPTTVDDEKVQAFDKGQYRTWFLVIVALGAFMLLGKYGGLVPATFVLVFLSALADRTNTTKVALALAAGVTVAAAGVFHYGMQLQFPLFTWG